MSQLVDRIRVSVDAEPEVAVSIVNEKARRDSKPGTGTSSGECITQRPLGGNIGLQRR